MAFVCATVVYEFDVPELDELEGEDFYTRLEMIKDDWSSYLDEAGSYTSWCEEVAES